MVIESYCFGEMVVNGVRYDKDLIVCPDNVRDNWWRKEGHRVSLEDIRELLEAVQPDTLPLPATMVR